MRTSFTSRCRFVSTAPARCFRRCSLQASLPPCLPTPQTMRDWMRSEEHTSELQSQSNLVCRLLLEKKKIHRPHSTQTRHSSSHLPDPRRRTGPLFHPRSRLSSTMRFSASVIEFRLCYPVSP